MMRLSHLMGVLDFCFHCGMTVRCLFVSQSPNSLIQTVKCSRFKRERMDAHLYDKFPPTGKRTAARPT